MSQEGRPCKCTGTIIIEPTTRCCRVEKGSWIVKQAVGQNTPVLLGKKLTTKYFAGPNYIEVICCQTHRKLCKRSEHLIKYVHTLRHLC